MNALEIKNLYKTYNNGVKALDGIDLVVREGDFFGLLGPNGAGKSTTIGTICSLVTKTAGSIHVFGIDFDKQPNLAKSMIGVVPQEFNFSIFEKVIDIVTCQAGFYGVPFKEAKEQAEFYLNKLQLWEKRNTAAKNLSGGMKRRLLIARALTHNPRMLILDEPTAGVDIEIRRAMWDFLQEINQQGITIILTTHYLEEAEMLCRNIGIINHGKIIKNAPTKDLISELEQESFLVDLASSPNELPLIPDVNIKHLDTLTLEITKPKHILLSAIFSELAKKEIQVSSLKNKSNRLEEFFISITNQNHHE